MSKLTLTIAAVAIVSLIAGGQADAQIESFGYPADGAGCSTGCAGPSLGAQQRAQGFGQTMNRFRSTQNQNERIYARNAAWPKPFACASRQHYHNLWQNMYDAGWEDQCILTSIHFDEKGELTRYGEQQIGGMMMNMPQSRRRIFVQVTADTDETNMRLAKVQKVIETMYPQRGGEVHRSVRTPATMSGLNAENIYNNAAANAPIPIIPIADGSSGVAGAVTQ